MLDRVITNFSVDTVIQRQRAWIEHIKTIELRARKMIVNEDKTYTTQNLHVCKTSL